MRRPGDFSAPLPGDRSGARRSEQEVAGKFFDRVVACTAVCAGRAIWASVLLAGLVVSAGARQGAAGFEPQVGQPGKDVVWVPTPPELVKEMLDLAEVTAADFVMDLGAGDGRIAIAAGQRGARALGIEYNPEMVALSNRNAAQAGVADRVHFVKADLFDTDLGPATVVTLYLLPYLNLKLRPRLLALRPGTRIVSHAFGMEDWAPDKHAMVDARDAYLWIVPAPVAGTWRLSYRGAGGAGSAEIALTQAFQKFHGIAVIDAKTEADVVDGALNGAAIAFALDDGKGLRREFVGRVADGRIDGTVKLPGGASAPFTAVRLR